ncbi:MAG: hypothetical protein LBD30_08700 [Verrucomicrobiales bacterium]|jgi:hypothetical protein|nr:hypothetical protein [Verrucomicrobiales bacterium]
MRAPLTLLLPLLSLSACGLIPEPVRHDDPRLPPLWQAVAAVDRAALGFTPIAATDQLRLETRTRAGYDAMLHTHGKTARTIAFRKTAGGCQWIGEQEIHTGPRTYEGPDGIEHERLVITYELVKLSGAPLNEICITYRGEDPRLARPRRLTLADVQPILAEWDAATPGVNPPPPSRTRASR